MQALCHCGGLDQVAFTHITSDEVVELLDEVLPLSGHFHLLPSDRWRDIGDYVWGVEDLWSEQLRVELKARLCRRAPCPYVLAFSAFGDITL